MCDYTSLGNAATLGGSLLVNWAVQGGQVCHQMVYAGAGGSGWASFGPGSAMVNAQPVAAGVTGGNAAISRKTISAKTAAGVTDTNGYVINDSSATTTNGLTAQWGRSDGYDMSGSTTVVWAYGVRGGSAISEKHDAAATACLNIPANSLTAGPCSGNEPSDDSAAAPVAAAAAAATVAAAAGLLAA